MMPPRATVGPIGIPEMIFIGILALLIFGPYKLPELGRSLGKALTEFRRATSDLKRTFEDEMREAERHVSEASREISQAVALPAEAAPPEGAVTQSDPASSATAQAETPANGDAKSA